MFTDASKKPDSKEYSFVPGVNTRFAAPRPTVHAWLLIVPRNSLALCACVSAAFPPKKKPSPDSSPESIVPSCVDENTPAVPDGSFGENICDATFCVRSGVSCSAAKPQRVADFTLL